MKTKILLLGCGYTSVWTYKYLVKSLSKVQLQNTEIQVISTSKHHAFHGFTGEFLSGFLPISLRHTPQELLFAKANFIQGSVIKLHTASQTVAYFDIATNSVKTCQYDHLVIGTGSSDKTIQIPGIQEFTYSVKKDDGLRNIRQQIEKLLMESASNREAFTFNICGAGLAGVEIAANFSEYLEKLANYYPKLHEIGYHINLIHAGNCILPQMEAYPALINFAKKTLTKWGINIMLKSKIVEFLPSKILLENQTYINSDLTINTIGQKVSSPACDVALHIDIQGRILGNKHLNMTGFENIWIGGDIAAIPHISGKCNCRSDALWAIKHGTWIGQNIARKIQKKPLKTFTFWGLGQAASLGQNKAFTELYGLEIKGVLAWWIRFGFFLYFMPKRSSAWATIKAIIQKNNWVLEPKLLNTSAKTKQYFSEAS
jgi:NADH:ubiquinone reductase (H+-translocating)